MKIAAHKSAFTGWNTWYYRSMLSHVFLPESFCLSLGIKDYAKAGYLSEILIGRPEKDAEQVVTGPRSYDGSYTELHVEWHGIKMMVQSALTSEEELVILVTPHTTHLKSPLLIIESGILWNRPGTLERVNDSLIGHLPSRQFHVYPSKEPVDDPQLSAKTPYLALSLDTPTGLSTGRRRTEEQIRSIVEAAKTELLNKMRQFGPLEDIYGPIQNTLAWNTTYDPTRDRVMTPVNRRWSCEWGGSVLYCWDNYFAAYLASIDNKDLAYANAFAITSEITEKGFVPGCSAASGFKTRDRSQPPVGSMVVKKLYDRFKDKGLLEALFADLLRWNRWWSQYRDWDGYLCWGSNPCEPVMGNEWEHLGVSDTYGGALESGLDNSPMYDDIPFDKQKGMMMLADVGLMGLYIMDCEYLAGIAEAIDRREDAKELLTRAEKYRKNLANLWCEEFGLFLNRRMDTGQFSYRISPTNFYALLGKAATQSQAERMIKDHFYNSDEFWGDWIMPSISRNDPAFPEQEYWCGRIWAPMNFLVYLGLRNYNLTQARRDLVDKSKLLLLKEWKEKGHVHENYCPTTGEGCSTTSRTEWFYFWGGLLGLMEFIENGDMP